MAYLTHERYESHEIHTGMSSMLTKKPEKRMNGRMKLADADCAAFGFGMIAPMRMPTHTQERGRVSGEGTDIA